MAVTLVLVLLLGAIAAAADDVPITWWRSPPALLQCDVPDAERLAPRRPPPPLDAGERPRPKPYLWRRGDEELKRVSNGTFEVSRRNGEGVYQCAVRHHGGFVLGYPVNLKFAYLDKQFSAHPENATARAGQPFVLTCNISSGPPAAITWLRDDKPLPDDKRYHWINMNTQLLIADVQKEDAGLYRCKAVNSHALKTRLSNVGQLQVEENFEDLEIAQLPLKVETDIYAEKGSKVVLPCPLVGWPRPKLIWELTPTVGRTGELEDEDQVLVLPSLELDQEGIYTCSVEGNSDLVKTFKVTMTEPVVITVPPTSKQTVRATTVRFNCTAVGKPTPTITWYKNGQLLESGRVAVIASPDAKRIELLIRSVTSSDGGVYQCFAHNGHGSSSAWAWLEVGGAGAAAPRGVRCRPAGARALAVRWDPLPDTVIAYNVQTSRIGGPSLPGQPILGNEDKITVSEPLTPFKFEVRAFIHSSVNNKTFASDMSEGVICQGQGVPIKLAKFDDSVLVSWKEFALKYPGVVEWILQYKAENSSEEHNITLNGNVYNYTLNVAPLQPFQVRVLGSRSAEWLRQDLALVPWTSTSVASHHLDGKVTAVPEDVEMSEVKSRQFTARWRCEDTDEAPKQIYTYMVCTRKVDGDEDCVDSSSTSVTVKNLHPNTEYVVRVQARIPGRTVGGEFSVPLHIITPIDDAQLTNISYKFINASTVRVSWESRPGKYTLRYSSELKLPFAQWPVDEPVGNSVLISGVDLTKELFVMIEEALGYRSILTIPVQVPEAKDLQYTYTKSGVFVTWKGPGPRVVKYSQNLTQSLEKWPIILVNDSSVMITGLEVSNSTYVMVAAPGPSQRNQVLTIPPRPLVVEQTDYSLYYKVAAICAGIIALCMIAGAAVCVWRRRKRARSPVRSRRNWTSNEGTEEEGSEMRNVGGRLANGGGSKDAGEPLLNGHVHITENPTVQQAKTPNGRMRKGRHYEPAFDVSRYDDPDTTLETVLDVDTTASTAYNLLDTSRKPEYDVSRSSRDVSANNSFNKLPDDNMNSEITRSTDYGLDNSKIQPTLQPNG